MILASCFLLLVITTRVVQVLASSCTKSCFGKNSLRWPGRPLVFLGFGFQTSASRNKLNLLIVPLVSRSLVH